MFVLSERGRKVPIVTLTRVSDLLPSPVGTTSIVQVVEVVELMRREHREATISRFPRLLALTPIQRHILKCVAAHCWTHQGGIPYHPPTEHQAATACDLAGPGWRLLLQQPARRPTYILTRLGIAAARRVLHVVPADADRACEREFDRMRALMRHDLRSLTTVDVDDDDDA
jgi:hypothetical protein